MSNEVCMNCGAKNPEHMSRYIAVNVSANSSTSRSGRKQVTTTVTTESVVGAEKFVVCDKCIQSKRRSYAILCGIGGLFAGFFGSLLLAAVFTGKRFFNSHVSGIMTVVCIAAVICAVCWFISAMREEAPFTGARLLRKKKGAAANGVVYVPTDRSLYPDLAAFKSKTGLKTGVGDMVFLQCIASGLGDMVVDQILAQQEQPAAAPVVTDKLSVYLDIDKLGGGVYGLSAGRAVAGAVPAAMLEGMRVSSGDSRATLAGSANEYVVGLEGDKAALDAVEARLRADAGLAELLSASGIRRGASNEALVDDGTVRDGALLDPPGRSTSFCGVGFREAWKEPEA